MGRGEPIRGSQEEMTTVLQFEEKEISTFREKVIREYYWSLKLRNWFPSRYIEAKKNFRLLQELDLLKEHEDPL